MSDLESAYGLTSTEDNQKLYAEWAGTYDAEFARDKGYVLPRQVVDAFVEAGGTGPVLDMGAGTGLCGERLSEAGTGPRHATDLSPEMLKVAETKGVYQSLFQGDILKGLPVPDGAYKGLVCAGTFTLGHVGPEGLSEVLRVLAPGGLAVVSVRDRHFEEAGFAKALLDLSPMIKRSEQIVRPIYEGVDGPHANDQALLLLLWR